MAKTKNTAIRTYTVKLTDKNNADNKVKKLTVPKKVIPVMFVPGVMGSCLKSRDIFTKQKTRVVTTDVEVLRQAPIKTNEAWALNEMGTMSGINKSFALREHRAELLNPDLASVMWEVSDTGKEDTDSDKALKIKRGWGTVLRDSYWDFFHNLETFFANDAVATFLKTPLAEKEKQDNNQDTVELNSWLDLLQLRRDMGNNETVLNQAELLKLLKNIQNYDFRLYVCGYNWLRDNHESANGYKSTSAEYLEANENRLSNKKYGQSDLKSRIAQAKQETGAEKVIIITHSMGGLVARAYCANAANAQNVYGVFHSVMPANGTPAFYKRARSGFANEADGVKESVVNAVIGSSAMTMDPVLLKAPGPLQLMPWTSYTCIPNIQKQGKNFWLGVKDKDNKVLFTRNTTELLNNNQAWYGLLPDSTQLKSTIHNPQSSFVGGNKSGIEIPHPFRQRTRDGITYEPRINPNPLIYLDQKGQRIDDQTFFKKVLSQVKTFCQTYDNKYFSNTIIAYVNNLPSWDAVYWQITQVLKNTQPSTLTEADDIQTIFEKAKLIEDNGVGKIIIEYAQYQIALALEAPGDLGDGTVAVSSRQAPTSQAKQTFIFTDYTHDAVYSKTAPHNHLAALYAILQFSKEIKES